MIESHPYEAFVPANASVLIIGSFPGIQYTRKPADSDEWFYSAKRNQFWKIIEAVYNVSLRTVIHKKQLFTEKGIAVTDIILEAERRKDSNLDQHLYNIKFNTQVIRSLLKNNGIKRVLFTSRFVQNHFKRIFPDVNNTDCLPSPSPRYVRISLKEKTEIYREKLPK